MYKPNIKAMFHKLNAEHFNNEIPDISVVWNTRMTTTAGYCRYRKFRPSHVEGSWSARNRIEPYQIDLSEKLFRNEGFDVAKVERTLVHEMVHAFLIHKYCEKGHTARFQRMMTEITGEYKNHRCHNYNVEGLRRKQAKNVIWRCEGCGAEGRRTRMPKRGRTYQCRGCKGRITFSKVSSDCVNIF